MANRLLTTTQEVLEEIGTIIKQSPDKIGISACTTKVIMDAVFQALNEIDGEYNPCIVVNSLTGRDSLGASFLFQVNRLSKHIRIERAAAHNIIVGENSALFISDSTNKAAANQLMGVLLEDETVKQIQDYVMGLWKNGMPLRLG